MAALLSLLGAGGAAAGGAAAGSTLGASAAGGLGATALGSMAAPTAGASMAAPAAASAIPAATITSPALTVTPQIASQTTGGLGNMMMDAMKSSMNKGGGSQMPGLIPTQDNPSRVEKRRMF